MESPIVALSPEIEKKQELKKTIDFYVNHLDIRELIILKEMAHKLADNYSKSYLEWRNKD